MTREFARYAKTVEEKLADETAMAFMRRVKIELLQGVTKDQTERIRVQSHRIADLEGKLDRVLRGVDTDV